MLSSVDFHISTVFVNEINEIKTVLAHDKVSEKKSIEMIAAKHYLEERLVQIKNKDKE